MTALRARSVLVVSNLKPAPRARGGAPDGWQILLGSVPIRQRLELQFRRVNHRVLDALAFPGVGDVDETVARLNDGGKAELFARLIFKYPRLESFRANHTVRFASSFFSRELSSSLGADLRPSVPKLWLPITTTSGGRATDPTAVTAKKTKPLTGQFNNDNVGHGTER